MTPEKLKEIQDKIQTATTEIARAEGTQEQLLSSMKTEFNVSTVGEAEAKLEELEKKRGQSQKRLDTLIEDLNNAIPE